MAKKRGLKDALSDPLVAKKGAPKKGAGQQEARKAKPKKGLGKTVLVAAIAAGFVCGWLAGRFFRVV
jgi:hypothetical protein